MKLIASKLKDIEIACSMQETYDFYKNKKLDIVLAQRLHSIILSQVYEIPFV
jgi:polysaccharide pyruvyl transferase WcaK-like protein